MKLDRLRSVLQSRPKTKIYVVTDAYCLCGYAHDAHADGPNLHVRIGAFVRVELGSTAVVEGDSSPDTLVLAPEHKVTRRIQTHRRHVGALEIPEKYFEVAWSL